MPRAEILHIYTSPTSPICGIRHILAARLLDIADPINRLQEQDSRLYGTVDGGIRPHRTSLKVASPFILNTDPPRYLASVFHSNTVGNLHISGSDVSST